MAAVRRAALRARLVAAWLLALGVLVQFLLAGFALCGAISFDAHELVGFVVGHYLAALVLLLSLVMWRGARDFALVLPLVALAFAQPLLPEVDNGWIAGLHPVNALAIGFLADRLARRDLDLVRARELPAAGATEPAIP